MVELRDQNVKVRVMQSLNADNKLQLLYRGGAGREGGGPGVQTPPAPTKATCGKRRDSMSFFWGVGEGEES